MARKTLPELPDKHCERCQKPFNRYVHPTTGYTIESREKFLFRRFCSKVCSNAFLRERMDARRKEINDKRLAKVTGEYEPAELWEQKWFITYRELVEKTLKELDSFVTLPQLRRVMGEDYDDRHILDAFEASHHVLRVPTLPLEKFCWIERPDRSLPVEVLHVGRAADRTVAELGL